MQGLNATIAKYYLSDELFVDQVEEIIDLLTERLAERFSYVQAVDKANFIIAKYYLNICRHKARWSTSFQPSKTSAIFR